MIWSSCPKICTVSGAIPEISTNGLKNVNEVPLLAGEQEGLATYQIRQPGISLFHRAVSDQRSLDLEPAFHLEDFDLEVSLEPGTVRRPLTHSARRSAVSVMLECEGEQERFGVSALWISK
jgi:hypothetical protein